MKAFAPLLIRLVAIYLVATSIIQSFVLIPMVASENAGDLPKLAFGIYILIPAATGIAIWLFGPRFMPKGVIEEPGTDEKALIRAGTFLIGIYWGLNSLTRVLGRYEATQEIDYGAMVVLALAVFLIVGSNAVLRLYYLVREFGQDA